MELAGLVLPPVLTAPSTRMSVLSARLAMELLLVCVSLVPQQAVYLAMLILRSVCNVQ